jgi:hypothetical protein
MHWKKKAFVANILEAPETHQLACVAAFIEKEYDREYVFS